MRTGPLGSSAAVEAKSGTGGPVVVCVHVRAGGLPRARVQQHCRSSRPTEPGSADMEDAEWTAGPLLLPTPPCLEGRGGRPEGYCHRQIDAIRYLVAAGFPGVCCPP